MGSVESENQSGTVSRWLTPGDRSAADDDEARPPRVSVVVPFLNAASFLDEAVGGVFAQTYDDWELLLVDDGSSDGSSAMARRYAAQRPDRVRYLQHAGHRSRGASASRNLATRHARGEYIAFLDSDDVWLPRKLEQQVPLLDALPEAAMLCGRVLHWYSWTGHPDDAGRDFSPDLGVEPDALIRPPTLFIRILRRHSFVPCTSSLLLRREAVERVGGYEVRFRQVYTDQVFYAKLCLTAPIFVSSACWVKYRQHPDSSVAVVVRSGRQRAARLAFLRWLRGYLSARGLRGTEVWRALEIELARCRHPLALRLSRRVQPLLRRLRRLRRRVGRDR